jgi:hypothetical protein
MLAKRVSQDWKTDPVDPGGGMLPQNPGYVTLHWADQFRTVRNERKRSLKVMKSVPGPECA